MKKLKQHLKKNEKAQIEDADALLKELGYTTENESSYTDAKIVIIEHNLALLEQEKRKHKQLQSQIVRLQNDIEPSQTTEVEKVTYVRIKETTSAKKFISANTYVSQLMDCKNEEEIEIVLPTANEFEYEEKLKAILLQLNADINFTIRLLKDCNEDEKEILRKDIKHMQFIASVIMKTMRQEEHIEIEEGEKPEIYFLTRDKIGDNTAIVVSDLNDIVDVNNAKSFYKLIDDFESGRFLQKLGDFRKGRKFTGNQKIKDLHETKDNMARITYCNLGNNKYILLKAFVKKTDKNTVVSGNLTNAFEIFKKQEADILQKLEDPEYLVQQQTYLEEAKRILALKGGVNIS